MQLKAHKKRLHFCATLLRWINKIASQPFSVFKTILSSFYNTQCSKIDISFAVCWMRNRGDPASLVGECKHCNMSLFKVIFLCSSLSYLIISYPHRQSHLRTGTFHQRANEKIVGKSVLFTDFFKRPE